ncbi:FG-GAP-like repeat-containing protein [Roseiconus nitratireducens]|nr:FG-GAP-like repeat-containing protein [Roseiconus nitratireducens]
MPNRKRRNARKLPRRLRAEALESRRVLATYVVGTTDDFSGGACAADPPAPVLDCSLRSAIETAATNPGADRVEIPAGTYLLDPQLGPLVVRNAEDLSLVGQGNSAVEVIIDAQRQSRVLDLVASGPTYTFLLENLSLQNGVASDGAGGGGVRSSVATQLVLQNVVLQNHSADRLDVQVTDGGAILAFGDLDVSDSRLIGNNASGNGGAISALGAGATVTIRNSQLESNQAGDPNGTTGDGGAVHVNNSVNLVLDAVNMSDNTAVGSGGAISLLGTTGIATLSASASSFYRNQSGGNGGALLVNRGSFSMTNVTVTENQSAGNGGGLFFSSLDPPVLPSILASTFADNVAVAGSNLAAAGGPIQVQSSIFSGGNALLSSGAIVSQGFNLDSGNSMGFDQAGDQVNTDPRLGVLGGYGGPVQTLPLLPGSLAIDAVAAGISPVAVDARGIPRPQDGDADGSALSDVGAFEVIRVIPPTIRISDVTVNESDGNASVDLTLDSATPSPFTVGVFTQDLTASAGTDYTATDIAVNFNGFTGEVQSISVPILDDLQGESAEQFQIALRTASDPTIDTSAVGVVTIQDDDVSDLVSETQLISASDPKVGDTITFQTTVFNAGPSRATSVSLINSLPSGLNATANHGAVTAGSYDVSTGRWNLDTIESGQTVTLTIEGIADVSAGATTVVNQISAASGDQSDPSTVGDQLSDSVAVRIAVNASADSFTIAEDESDAALLRLDVLANDTPSGLTIIDSGFASLGTVTIEPGGTALRYAPDPDLFGQDVFSYTVVAADGQTATANVTVNLTPVNDDPVVGDDQLDVRSVGTFAINLGDLLANDVPGPANESGQALVIDSVASFSAAGAAVTLQGNQILVTPADDFVGRTDSFDYSVRDEQGAVGTGRVSITFIPNLSGHAYCDQNSNGTEDAGESIVGTRIFVDANGNQSFDDGEFNTRTDSNGDYRFIGAPAGDFAVIAERPAACPSIPASPGVFRTTFDVGNLARSMTAADRDGDGDQDLLVAVDYDNALVVVRNDSGELSLADEIIIGTRPQSVVAGPSDIGQRPAIAVATIGQSEDGGAIYVGNTTFTEVRAANGPIDLVLEDLDNDGTLELVSTSFRSSTLTVSGSDGSAPFTLATGTEQIYTLDVGDVDGDGDADLLVAGIGYGDGSEVNLLIQDQPLQFSAAISAGPALDLMNAYVDVAVVDIDGDGTGELLTLDQEGNLRTLAYRGGSLELLGETAVAADASQFSFGDLNSDGIEDVAVASLRGNLIKLFVGRGDGQFDLIQTVDDLPTPSDLQVVDLQNDGFAEIAVLNLYGALTPGSSLPSTITVLRLDVSVSEITITQDESTLDYVFPGTARTSQLDVTGDGVVSPRDALHVINRVGWWQDSQASGENVARMRQSADLNLDGQVTPMDVLLIINHLDRQHNQDALSQRLGDSAGRSLRAEMDPEATDLVFGTQLF